MVRRLQTENQVVWKWVPYHVRASDDGIVLVIMRPDPSGTGGS